MDGEVTIATQRGNPQETIDELKDLLFELGYVQLHTSEQNTKAIFEKVTEIIQILNDFEADETQKQKELPTFYSQLSSHLFQIITILKQDLYGVQANTIDPQTVKGLLESCDLFVDGKVLDKYELQNYFWNELQNQLLQLGYQFDKKDFSADVNLYYARAKNRHRYYGLTFPIFTAKDGYVVHFSMELQNELYYGFSGEDEKNTHRGVKACMKEMLGFSLNSEAWFGWKSFDRNRLDFWKLDSPALILLQNPRKRERLVGEIVKEMDQYIKMFQDVANEQDL